MLNKYFFTYVATNSIHLKKNFNINKIRKFLLYLQKYTIVIYNFQNFQKDELRLKSDASVKF